MPLSKVQTRPRPPCPGIARNTRSSGAIRGGKTVICEEIEKDSEDGRFPSDPYIITADCEVAGC
jgi:hypothetical protein